MSEGRPPNPPNNDPFLLPPAKCTRGANRAEQYALLTSSTSSSKPKTLVTTSTSSSIAESVVAASTAVKVTTVASTVASPTVKYRLPLAAEETESSPSTASETDTASSTPFTSPVATSVLLPPIPVPLILPTLPPLLDDSDVTGLIELFDETVFFAGGAAAEMEDDEAVAVAPAPAAGPFTTKYEPPLFHGSEDAEVWLRLFEHYVDYRNMDDPAKLRYMPLVLRESAADWLSNLPDGEKDTYAHLAAAFRANFIDDEMVRTENTNKLWNRKQGADETVKSYFTAMKTLARPIALPDAMLKHAIVQGLRPHIRVHVVQSAPATVDAAFQLAKLAELANAPPTNEVTLATLLEELKFARHETTREQRGFNQENSTSTPREPPQRPQLAQQQQQEFRSTAAQNNESTSGHQHTSYRGRGRGRGRWNRNTSYNRTLPPQQFNTRGGLTQRHSVCGRCGFDHWNEGCRAVNMECYKCGKRGHMSRVCRSGQQQTPSQH